MVRRRRERGRNPPVEKDAVTRAKAVSKSRENVHRISMAGAIFVFGIAVSVGSFVLLSPIYTRMDLSEFYFYHVEWTHDQTTFAAALDCFGGLNVGVGTGSLQGNRPNLRDTGYGVDLFGFQLSNHIYRTNNGDLDGRWRIFGLPLWFILALIMGRRLDRVALRRGAYNDARRARLRRKREALDGWWEFQMFRRNPVCRVCGYDMRATRDRCPECAWVPDFPMPPEARRS